jgi:hypothetical protein
MTQYSYVTDASSGKIKAESLADAFSILRDRITDEMIQNGATLWVAEEDGSNRIELESE